MEELQAQAALAARGEELLAKVGELKEQREKAAALQAENDALEKQKREFEEANANAMPAGCKCGGALDACCKVDPCGLNVEGRGTARAFSW